MISSFLCFPHSRTSRPPFHFVAALAVLSAAGCGDDEGFVAAAPVTVAWDSTAADRALVYTMTTPTATQRLLAMPDVCVERPANATITGVSLGTAALAFEAHAAFFGGSCARLSLSNPTLQEGDVLVVSLSTDEGPTTVDVVVPALPTPPASAFHATAALRTNDGTTWLATPHHGLVGVTTEGRVIDYVGVASAVPWDPAAREPQSGLVLALAPAGGRALWVSSAVTGISWFDPGDDAMLRADDRWIHGQPLAEPQLAAELAQTAVAIAVDPTDPNGLWVASLNGLYHARKQGEQIDFVRVAEGFALSLAVDPYGRVWAGFSTQVLIDVPDEDDLVAGPVVHLTPASGALLVLTPGSDSHDPSNADLRWALEDEDAVTSILPDAHGAWVGTPYGLTRVSDDALTLGAVPAVTLGPDLAVVDLAPTSDGFWLAARAECEVGKGRLLRVQLDDSGAIIAVVDHSDAMGFGERDFAWLQTLPSGELLVSTLVPVPKGLTGDQSVTARGCALAPASERSADLYVLAPDGHVRRFGTDF